MRVEAYPVTGLGVFDGSCDWPALHRRRLRPLRRRLHPELTRRAGSLEQDR